MKKTLILFAVLYGFVSFAQEENTSQIEPVRIILQKQATPSAINATTTSANNKADNNDSRTPVVNIIAAKSTISRGEKATMLMADDKTHITNVSEANNVSISAERSSQPQTLKATSIKSDQKQ